MSLTFRRAEGFVSRTDFALYILKLGCSTCISKCLARSTAGFIKVLSKSSKLGVNRFSTTNSLYMSLARKKLLKVANCCWWTATLILPGYQIDASHLWNIYISTSTSKFVFVVV